MLNALMSPDFPGKLHHLYFPFSLLTVNPHCRSVCVLQDIDYLENKFGKPGLDAAQPGGVTFPKVFPHTGRANSIYPTFPNHLPPTPVKWRQIFTKFLRGKYPFSDQPANRHQLSRVARRPVQDDDGDDHGVSTRMRPTTTNVEIFQVIQHRTCARGRGLHDGGGGRLAARAKQPGRNLFPV